MDLQKLVVKCGYKLDAENEIPTFFFVVADIAPVQKLLQGMYVELDVLMNTEKELAYVLAVPDRQIMPVAIPLNKEDLPKLQKGAALMNICPTMIAGIQGGMIKLTEFVEDLTFDWSGQYAQAIQAFQAQDIATAERLLHQVIAEHELMAAAHHMLGRCYRAQGAFDRAILSYRHGIEICTHIVGHKLLPRSAGMLSDMGVAYKVSGNIPKAVLCLLYSLSLRPNHPAALVTFATLFGEADDLFLHATARIIKLGGWDSLLEQVFQAYAGGLGKDKNRLLGQAKKMAEGVDFTVWPLRVSGELSSDQFFMELDQTSQMPKIPILADDGSKSSAAKGSDKPWWKVW